MPHIENQKLKCDIAGLVSEIEEVKLSAPRGLSSVLPIVKDINHNNIEISIDSSGYDIIINVDVKFGNLIPKVCWDIQEKVKNYLKANDLKYKTIDIKVQGVIEND